MSGYVVLISGRLKIFISISLICPTFSKKRKYAIGYAYIT